MANFKPSYLIRRLFVSGGKKVIMGSAIQSSKDLTYLKELIEAGTIKPVIDRDFLLEQIADAHRYAESGKKKGNIAITVAAT